MADLVIQGLAKAFGKARVLDGVDLAVAAGETVVVCGPSGAGKTLLLRLIAGTVEPDAGEIVIAGQPLAALGPERRGLAMAFQNFALYPHLSAFENIASPLRARGWDEARLRARVAEVADLLRIGHVLGHPPRELSNGQKQRTSLARALASGPGVVLLDDPLRNVDAKLRYEMRLELPRLLRAFDAAVLYVTQDYREAMALGDRIAFLRDGRLEQVDVPAALYGQPASVEVARRFGDPTINLVPCRPERAPGGARIGLLGGALTLPAGLAHAAGRACLAGLRPEHVEVRLEPGADGIAAELETVMPLNVRSVLYLRGAGQELLATVPEDRAADYGRGRRPVWVAIDPAQVLLFDAETRARIALLSH